VKLLKSNRDLATLEVGTSLNSFEKWIVCHKYAIMENIVITCIVAKTPQGPPSCCTRPIDVSGSELNLEKSFHSISKKTSK
jgi:hypothetical protein